MPRTGRKSGKGELILVVDDYQDAREMYAEYLEYAGYRVATAANGAEAVEKTFREKPEAILMDLSMPLLNGCEATRILKSDQRTRRIPVLALSGHEIGSQQAREAGCNDFLLRPCPPEEVEQRIRRLLLGRDDP
jgi:two-component system, cell cycle response regulator DivK